MIIFVVICVIFVIACTVIQIKVRRETAELEKEAEKYETLITSTKSGEQVETEYTHIEDNKFFVKIPKSFETLDSETINIKYNGDVPSVVFSNEDITINIAINMTENDMSNDEIEEYKNQMEEMSKDSSEILSSNYYEVDNHNVGQIKMMTEAVDTNIYNNIIFFSYNDKLVLINFNCTEELREEWEGVGDFITDSLFFTD